MFVTAGRSTGMASSGGTVEFVAGESKIKGGNIVMRAGYAHGSTRVGAAAGNGGNFAVRGGTSEGDSPAGYVSMVAGGALNETGTPFGTQTGGTVSLTSGASLSTSSGDLVVASHNAGVRGTSGEISIRTGAAKTGLSSRREGSSGQILLRTPNTYHGPAGSVLLSVGVAGTNPPSRLASKGGSVKFTAGTTSAPFAASGGRVVVMGGEGRNTNNIDGGDGGAVRIQGGEAHGLASEDMGGAIEITGGPVSGNGYGGTIALVSGPSADRTTGNMDISTARTFRGTSGIVNITTGGSFGSGNQAYSGGIHLVTGVSKDGQGGRISMTAGWR